MSKLREKLIEIQKEKTLREVLGDEEYEKADEKKRAHILSFVEQNIISDVDKLINEEVRRINDSTPEVKSKKKLNRIALLIMGLATAGLTVTASVQQWWAMGISAVFFIVGVIMQFMNDR